MYGMRLTKEGNLNLDAYSNDNDLTLKTLSYEKLEVLDKFINVPMILLNDKEVLYLNGGCLEVLGYEKGSLAEDKPLDLSKLIPDESSIEFISSVINNVISPVNHRFTMYNKCNERRHFELKGEIVIYNSEKCILATLRDISYSKELESYIFRISELRRLMLEVTRLALEIDDIHQLFQLILEITLKCIEGGTVGTIMINKGDHFIVGSQVGFFDDIKDFKLPFEDAFLYRATNGKMDRIAIISDLMNSNKYYRIRTKYGEEIFIKSSLSAPIYVRGKLLGMINIDSIENNSFDEDDVKTMEFIRNYIEIIISNYLLYEEKCHLAKYDYLTQFYNRSCFEEKTGVILENAASCSESFNLIIFDINDLKEVNDSLGHLAGDEVIKKFASILKNNIRKTDIVGRLGGDEFVGVFFNTNKENLNKKFLNLLKKMESQTIMIRGKEIKCTFSYGIANFPEDGATFKELVSVADKRMYQFKKEYKAKL
ncbi:sensor domain-containing diguanylate cyclase [Tepidimicrobium xylanilyticum]|uniref:Diguanylate cyclase (GGDEF) domain-containing protein n=1 Tax=Tepidimicrobium xylanilyticum TaxID=1123352 RepID=A0A1H2TDT3_9FIRM|nr:sensor domain-containing diguanylate cyclase [Tepidimicrobium xylanilyticum]SDW41424.1 diguanylate cyclase (GGDEF) domain-containing protein [Tepidimicrobium xylanilyticum]